MAELEAYLSAAGLKDTTLSASELQALERLKQDKIKFSTFRFEQIFEHIRQGRRLKKDDQIPGEIPFVMAGTTNTGVVGHVANPVAAFPKNSITIDIFGNAFYRSFDYGAGDDTGVYWRESNELSRESMLFLTAAMQKSVAGKFSFGNKLRSSQSFKLEMQLPCIDGEPDFACMHVLISAMQKLVIKDVVKYADKKIAATQKVLKRHAI